MAIYADQAPQNLRALQNGSSASEKGVDGRNSPTQRRSIKERFQALASTCIHPWTSFRKCREERKRTKKPATKHAPVNLTFLGLLLLLVFEIFILITIAVLWVLTTRRNGFVDVPDTPASLIGDSNLRERLLWALSLLWTFLPAFIVSMCGALFKRTLAELEGCQPTIELRKQADSGDLCPPYDLLPITKDGPSHQIQEKSKAKLSVLLDYGSYQFPFLDSYHSFRNKHFLICACTIVKWFFVAVGPLAAAIISVGSVPSSQSVQVTTSKVFDDWSNQSFHSSTQPAFEIASATLLNKASPYSWSTDKYSVVPFFTEDDVSGNITANTGTYSATLDCVHVDVDALLGAGNITRDWQNTTLFTFVDRGCLANPWIGVSQDPPLYAEIFYVNCPFEAGQARLVLMTGTYDNASPTWLKDFSLLSCIPQFWNSTSRVSVLSGTNTLGQSGQVVDILPDWSSVKPWWPEFASTWLWDLPRYQVSDPSQSIRADNFGLIAYNYATKLKGTGDFAQAMNATFNVLFATFAALSTYSSLSENVTFAATLSRPGNRLFVVFLQAAIVTVVMALAFVVTLCIAAFAYRHRVVLKDHLDLILGHAILLEGNEGVSDYIKTVRKDFERQAEVAARAEAAKAAENPCEARKTQRTLSSELAIDLAVKHALRNGDLVKYAKDNRSLGEWDCWAENGKLCMEPGLTSDPSQPNFFEQSLERLKKWWSR